MRSTITPTGIERHFDDNEIIVSKTDPGGRITYANDVFIRISGYTESELINQPHSLIRHPDMPRCVFDLLWSTLKSGKEIFAYVVNLCKNGDHYWVLAHITPTFDNSGNIIAYHSNRRVPKRQSVEAIQKIYKTLLAEEAKYGNSIDGMKSASRLMQSKFAELEVEYDEFVFSMEVAA